MRHGLRDAIEGSRLRRHRRVFQGKYLQVRGTKSPGRRAILDPRFPEVREYLSRTYERVVGEWGFDGLIPA